MMKPGYLDAKQISDAAVLKVFEAVDSYGGALRFVGGVVRDCLAGIQGSEIDLATDLTPDELVEACNEKGIKTVSVGLKFAKTGVVVGDRVFEVSSLHRSAKASDKDSDLSFTDDWNTDAATRDLTINAVYADENGNVFDYYNGISDLEKGVVRFIGSADDKIKEQPIRILRFFRFFSIFSKTDPDLKSLKACVENRELLKTVSREALRDEFLKILMSKNAAAAVKMMGENDILSFMLPDKYNTENLKNLQILVDSNNIEADEVRRLFVLFEPDSVMAGSLALRLRLNKAQKTRLINLSKFVFNPYLFNDLKYIRRVVFLHGKDFVKDKILILLASTGRTQASIKDLFADIDHMDIPVFPLNGKDLVEIGVQNCMPVKEIVGGLKNIWIESDFELKYDDLIKKAKLMIA